MDSRCSGFVGRTAAFLRIRECASDDADQLLEIERFGKILVRPFLRSAHGGNEGILRAHDDDGEIRPHFLYARQQIESILVRHHDVGNHEIAFALTDPAPQGGRVAG